MRMAKRKIIMLDRMVQTATGIVVAFEFREPP